MIKIIKKIKYIEGPAPHRRRKSSGSGFVILFAVTIAAILLSISLGVANIAFRELKFSTSAKDANDAFFAADTGAECALFYDKSTTSASVFTNSNTTIACNGVNNITVTPVSASHWQFIVPSLNYNTQGCALVTVKKSGSGPCGFDTCVVSQGYSNGDSSCAPASNAVQRELDVSY